jgi:hypothetical protein
MPSILKSGSFTLLKPSGLVRGLKKKKEEEEGVGEEKETKKKKCSFTSSTFKPFTVSLQKPVVAPALIAHHTQVLTECIGTS